MATNRSIIKKESPVLIDGNTIDKKLPAIDRYIVDKGLLTLINRDITDIKSPATTDKKAYI